VAGKVDAVPVDQRDPTPLYDQLAAILRRQIEAGELAPGQLLPSEGQLQQEHEVGRSTVRRALGILRDEGLVVTITARGTFVR
jgi:GntR family transcriptional regulator